MSRKKKKGCPSIPIWMTTFTDMTTLLLTFFILMFTVAEIDGNELKLILSSFSGSFGIMQGGLTLQKGPLAESGMTVESLPSEKSAYKLAKAFKNFRNKIKSMLSHESIKIKDSIRGLVISLPGKVYFEPNSSVLKPEGKILLEKVAYLLLDIKTNTGIDNQVEIEGHASLEPNTIGVNTLSNIWEHNLDLSLNRAKNVEKFFIKKFYEIGRAFPVIKKKNGKQIAKFVAKGYGEFEPLEDMDTPESRAWNRRVDIVIKRD